MPVKKSELYSSLWASCDELRGGMDASQYKDYVLVLLFVKYVSDKYTGQPYAPIVVPPGGSFADMVALKGNAEIGDRMNKIIGKLAEENNLKGTIDVADFNDPDKLGRGKEMVDRLTNLVAIFENPALDFSSNRAEGDDILGDAYEYLMRHFATQSGKSKGQFYTPAEVSRVIAQVIGVHSSIRPNQTIYDPTCGSGSLLLKAADQAPDGVTIYGQEMDNATAALARMNMILHDNPTAEIWLGNTLASPHWVEGSNLKTHDFVVANPPFSNKAWRTGFNPEEDLYGRFDYGIPPNKNGDYAFLLHVLASLKTTGKGAVVMPHGVLFRGNVEADIRRNLVQRGYIKGIIGLPANLFYGTGIPACIIVLDKENAAARTGIFMLDASQGYVKDGNKNRLRHQDIRKIVDVFNGQMELPKYSRMVLRAEIEGNDYNLNLPRYIDTAEPEDLQDISAHLRGGLPNRDIDALSRYWNVFPTLKADLFTGSGRPGYSELKVPATEIKSAILAHPEFTAYAERVNTVFSGWQLAHRQQFLDLHKGSRPQQLIDALAEDLLQVFAPLRLLDKYDIYQHLMAYWTEVMQDDVYIVVTGGWQAANQLRLLDGKSKETADLTIGKLKYRSDLIPPDLIIDRYFSADQAVIDMLAAELDAASQKVAELVEEHSGDEGLLSEVTNDRGSITRSVVTRRRREIWSDPEFEDELDVLETYLEIVETQSEKNRQLKAAQKMTNKLVVAKYGELSEAEIKSLVVEDKWLRTLSQMIQAELDRITQTLTTRIRELAGRYAAPLPQLKDEVHALTDKVNAHLQRMGFVWK